MMKTTFTALILAVLATGCINASQSGGLALYMQPDPPKVFSLGTVRINVDVENTNPRPVEVSYSIFDTGRLSFAQQPPGSACAADGIVMLDKEFKSFFCVLQAPVIDEDSILTEVHAKAVFRTSLPAVQVVELMSEQEYQRRAAGSTGFQTKPSSYVFRDRNVELAVDFDEPLPVVIRPGRRYFVHFTIKNIGNGLIGGLKHGDFSVVPASAGSFTITDCTNAGINDPKWRLDPAGKEFPGITCELTLPSGVAAVENYGMLALLQYSYEIRQSAIVQVMR